VAGSALVSATVAAQSGASPAFDVSSVRANRTDVSAATLFPLGPGDAYAATGGLFRAINQPLIAYVRFAYRLGQGELQDLPRWVYNDRFDIEARAAGEATKDQMRLMMRALLAERFQLAVHTEQRTQRIFELTLAEPGRLGPQLRPHRADSCAGGPAPVQPSGPSVSSPTPDSPLMFQLPTLPCGSSGFVTIGAGERGRIVGNGEPMDRVAEALRGPFTGIERFVRDRTGLTGTFDLSLEWSRVSDTLQSPGALLDDAGPRFQEALQQQLGLRLRSTTGPVEVLVVDRIELPTGN
jgi:uncharacterized protein (TIGR03435 family)